MNNYFDDSFYNSYIGGKKIMLNSVLSGLFRYSLINMGFFFVLLSL